MRTSEGENLKRGQREGRGGERGRDRVERPRQGREATGRRREGHREAPADGVVQRASGLRVAYENEPIVQLSVAE